MEQTHEHGTLIERTGQFLHDLWIGFMNLLHEEPLLTSATVVIVSAVLLYALARILKVALYFALVAAVLIGIAVFVIGPDQARQYLSDIGLPQDEGPPAK